MSGGNQPVDDEPVQLVAPGPEGEQLSRLINRLVFHDPTFARLASAARFFGVDYSQWGWFRPAGFSQERVETYHDALAAVEMDPRTDSFTRILDYLWRWSVDSDLPLALQMAQQPQPDLGGIWREPRQEPPLWLEGLRVARRAALRRDRLVAAVSEALKSGRWQAMGFLPGDYQRALVPVPRAWWGDEYMVCHWLVAELRPDEARTAGRPTYLGITVSGSSGEQRSATPANPAQADKTSNARLIEATCAEWLTQEWLPGGGSKASWRERARATPGLQHLTGKAFDRAWDTAAKVHPEMSRAGRPAVSGRK